jgi:hypothetical protein
LAVEARDVLFAVVLVAGAVEGALERRRDALDVFFWSEGGGWLALDVDDTEDFLSCCSVDAGARSWDWLPEDLSTGSRDVGRGIPDRTGMPDDWCSMVERGSLTRRGGSLTDRIRSGMRATHAKLECPMSNQRETRSASEAEDCFWLATHGVCVV